MNKAIHSAIVSALSGLDSMDRGLLQRTVAKELGIETYEVSTEVNTMLRLSRSVHGKFKSLHGLAMLGTDLADMPANHVAIVGIL